MKPIARYTLLFALLVPSIALGRTWSDSKGRSFEGTLKFYDKSTVEIRRDSDRRVFTIERKVLSTTDREYLVLLEKRDAPTVEKGEPANSCIANGDFRNGRRKWRGDVETRNGQLLLLADKRNTTYVYQELDTRNLETGNDEIFLRVRGRYYFSPDFETETSIGSKPNERYAKTNSLVVQIGYGNKTKIYFGSGPVLQSTVNRHGLKDIRGEWQDFSQRIRLHERIDELKHIDLMVALTIGKGKGYVLVDDLVIEPRQRE